MILSAHGLICDRVYGIRQSIIDADPTKPEYDIEAENSFTIATAMLGWESFEQLQQHQQHFLLQPLFRALIFIVDAQEYDDRVSDVSQSRVYVVRTEIEEGLSGPVDLAAIEGTTEPILDPVTGKIKAVCTTLQVAVRFLQALEHHESAAFGVRPCPVAGDEPFRSGYIPVASCLPMDARELGWPDFPLQGSSLMWVDTGICTEWIGSSTNRDRMMRQCEEYIRVGVEKERELREDKERGLPDPGPVIIIEEEEEVLDRVIKVDQGDEAPSASPGP